ncbi:MAG: hypothetical protein WC371_02120 [Parachlamydiales bacterium]
MDGLAYTLHGTKPITEISLEMEEEKAVQNNLADQNQAENVLVFNAKHSLSRSFEQWQKLLQKEKIKRFLVVEKKHSSKKNFRFLYFINIFETIQIMQKHYLLFKNYLGKEFDPATLVFEIEDENSLFWSKMFYEKPSVQSVSLWGVLYGYGLENAYPFSLFFQKFANKKAKAFFSDLINRTQKYFFSEKVDKNLSSQSFPLPAFRSFLENDPHKEKYRKEREKIKKIYRKKDLSTVVFDTLYH